MKISETLLRYCTSLKTGVPVNTIHQTTKDGCDSTKIGLQVNVRKQFAIAAWSFHQITKFSEAKTWQEIHLNGTKLILAKANQFN